MKIESVACVGGGLIGQGWATVFISKGYKTVLQDVSTGILETAVRNIATNLQFLQANGLFDQDAYNAALCRISTTTQISEAAARADYIQESVPEKYNRKKEVFREMDAVAPSHTILASSTSGLLMTEIQKETRRPERCVLVHPLLPVHLIPLVEVVGGDQTSKETSEVTCDFMRELGKIPVLLNKEVVGYIVNRLQAALLREAIDLVDKGVASVEDVDKAFCMGIGLRDPFLGPFLRIHVAGDGIERFLQNYAQSYAARWETMETWTSISAKAAQAVAKGVNEMEVVRTRSLDEIKAWRDKMLVNVLKAVA
jgi:3-hydroxypropionate dehydrogenase (NADP+)